MNLTPRQLAIIALMAQGKDHDEIAAELGVSAQTVKNHLSLAYKRLDLAVSSPGFRAVALYASGQLRGTALADMRRT